MDGSRDDEWLSNEPRKAQGRHSSLRNLQISPTVLKVGQFPPTWGNVHSAQLFAGKRFSFFLITADMVSCATFYDDVKY